MSERSIRRARERRIGRRTKVVIAAGAGLSATALAAPAAQAGTVGVVDSLDDDGSEGTLREEIYDANDDPGADTITFASGLTGEIVLDGGDGDILIDDPLTIQGPGADVISVSGDDQYQIFHADGAESLTISGLTLTEAFNDTAGGFGGALYANDEIDVNITDSVFTDNYALYGGAITNFDGTTTITNSVFSENVADGNGGALYMAGTTTITGSTFSANTAQDGTGGSIYQDDVSDSVGTLALQNTTIADSSSGRGGGGIYVNDTHPDANLGVSIVSSALTGNTAEGSGGGLYLDGGDSEDADILIDASTFSGNSTTGGGTDGGGAKLYDSLADVVIRNSTFANNTTEGYGGGIDLYDNGDVTIEGSTFAGNTSYYDGGGAVLWGTEGDVLVQHSTFSGNTAGTSDDEGPYNGGGLYSYNRATDPNPDEDTERTIRNTTIVNNTADTGGGIAAWLDSNDDVETEDVLTLSSTIVANNGGGDLSANQHAGSEPDNPGRFDLGFSLVGNPGGAPTTENPAGSNLFGVDPLLGPLQGNGGPTQTHAPAFNSPALDKGIANGLGADQRGLARTGDLSAVANAAGGDGTDIGSVELQVADCQGQGALKLDGTDGNDALTGTPGPDSIRALGGRDTANAQGGKDCVNGDAGKDKLKGAGGKDKVKGGAGKDNLKGGGGKDRLSGQGGKDKLSGGGGKDRLKGGPGKDRLKGGGGKDRFNCGGGKDKVTAQAKDRVSASCEKVVERG